MLSSNSSAAWKMRMQNLWQKVSQTSRDSWQLGRACCWKPPSTSALSSSERFKTILLEHAKMQNQVAIRILLLEKEWGLFRYHGAWGYFQRAWSSGSKLPKHDEKRDKNEEAQIAFMITSRMKQQLQEELGYSDTFIKSMTPLQASLVLQHQISPKDYDGKVSQLVEDYHAQQEQQRVQELQRKEQEEREQQQQTAMESNSHQLHAPSPNSTAGSHNTDAQNPLTQRSGITWYEVIQTEPNGEESKMGLYRSPEEAQEGIDALEYIAERRQQKKGATLSIRPSLR